MTRQVIDPQDTYWIVNDSSPTTSVYSTATGSFVSNSAAAYDTWLTDGDYLTAPGAFGFAMPIVSAADNGSGNTRLTLLSADTIQTGQRLYFEANGVQQITKINATQIDIPVAIGSYVAASAAWGPTIIPTNTQKVEVINEVAFRRFGSNFQVILASDHVVLDDYPQRQWTEVRIDVAGKHVILPVMNDPRSPPLGTTFYILNHPLPNAQTFDIYFADGVTPHTQNVRPGMFVEFIPIDNSTKNGTFETPRYAQLFYGPRGMSDIRGLQAANDGTNPTTQMDITFVEADLRDNSWQSPYTLTVPGSTISFTVDVSVAGPIANGRDRSPAFTAGTMLYWYVIWGTQTITPAGIVSQNPPSLGPVLPDGYTHWGFLFASQFNLSSQLETVNIGAGSIRTNIVGTVPLVGNRGWTFIPNAADILLGQGTGLDVAFKAMSGDATIDAAGAVTVAGGSLFKTNSITSGTTNLTSAHNGQTIFVDASAGNVTITFTAHSSLPSPWGTRFVRIDSSANTVTFDPNSTETIDGRLTARLISQYDEVTVIKGASNFYTVDAKWRKREVRITATGAYTFTVANEVPIGCSSFFVEATAAGGSGGGANTTTGQRMGGGGGGATGRIRIATTLDTSITGSVGTGGAAVANGAGGTAGNAGGNTTVVGTNLGTKTANGGAGGPTSTAGGAGGTVTGFDENLDGEDGLSTTHALTAVGSGGNAGGGLGVGAKSNVGTAGKAPGGGGSGSNHTPGGSTSGAGANGAVTFYI